ncbi:MAG: hypothetical protein WBM76_15305 [Woeseiaceae bacterium]
MQNSFTQNSRIASIAHGSFHPQLMGHRITKNGPLSGPVTFVIIELCDQGRAANASAIAWISSGVRLSEPMPPLFESMAS